MKILRYYRTGSGQETFQAWLKKLKDTVAVIQITKRIRRLTIGHYGDSSSVGDGIFDLRHYGPGYRVYYA